VGQHSGHAFAFLPFPRSTLLPLLLLLLLLLLLKFTVILQTTTKTTTTTKIKIAGETSKVFR